MIEVEEFIDRTKPVIARLAFSETCGHENTVEVPHHFSHIDPIKKCVACGRLKFGSEQRFRELRLDGEDLN